jgi:hypothetical protein
MESDRAYFSRRAANERTAAETASSPEARRAHLELAFRYEETASALYRSTNRPGNGSIAKQLFSTQC